MRGDSLGEALTRSHLLELNPGGEVSSLELPPGAAAELPPEFVEKFMKDQAALDEFDRAMAAARKGAAP